MFYIDLDELDIIHKQFRFFSKNKFNLFNFRDKDHIQLPKERPDSSKNLKEHIITYLSQNGIEQDAIGKIQLLTNVCTLGYIFSPVSFFFVSGTDEKPLCSVVEVCNTFLEIKPYFIDIQEFNSVKYQSRQTKFFYVSPFINHDAAFDFNLEIPGQKLNIQIDDYIEGTLIFKSSLVGKMTSFSDQNLLLYFLLFPLITIKIITAIHWQALLLWIKNIPYFKKHEHLNIQKDIYRPYKYTKKFKTKSLNY